MNIGIDRTCTVKTVSVRSVIISDFADDIALLEFTIPRPTGPAD